MGVIEENPEITSSPHSDALRSILATNQKQEETDQPKPVSTILDMLSAPKGASGDDEWDDWGDEDDTPKPSKTKKKLFVAKPTQSAPPDHILHENKPSRGALSSLADTLEDDNFFSGNQTKLNSSWKLVSTVR